MKPIHIKIIPVLVPYVAVLIGLYVFKNAWIAIGLYHFGIVAFLTIGYRDNSLKKVLSGWNSSIAIFSVLITVMVFPTIYFIWEHMRIENLQMQEKLSSFGLYGMSWIIFMIYFSTAQPLLEEIYWRGYLESAKKYFSWTDIAFAGYHVLVLAYFIKFPWLILAFIVLNIAACIWRIMALSFKGLAIPLLSHIVADISIILATWTLAL